jgi:concanavalin A-like lectin/glucanase superfamily protein
MPNNGTPVGSPTYTSCPARGSFPTTALTLNGTSQCVTIPNTIGQMPSSGNPLTVEFWALTSSDAGAGQMIAFAAVPATGQQYNLDWISGSSEIAFQYPAGGTASVHSGLNFDSAWHHYAMVMPGDGTFLLYVDGVAGSAGSQTVAAGVGGTVAIGAYAGSVLWFKGQIQQVAIWSTERYTTGFTPLTSPYIGTEPGLTALYPLSANANDITPDPPAALTGTPVVVSHSNSAILYSPGNWDGGVTNCIGAYFRIKYAGSAASLVTFNLSGQTAGAGLAPNGAFAYRAVGVTGWQKYPIAATVPIAIPTQGAGVYQELEFIYLVNGLAGNQWTLTDRLSLTSISFDQGATVETPTPRTSTILFYKDSTGLGAYTIGASADAFLDYDATFSVPYLLNAGCNAEVGIVAFSGQGVVNTVDFPYTLPNTYNKQSNAGSARPLTGYNLVVWGLGQNDFSYDTNFGTYQTTMIEAFQSASPSTKHLVLSDYRDQTVTGEHTSATNTGSTWLDGLYNLVVLTGTPGTDTWDGYHPNAYASASLLYPPISTAVNELLVTTPPTDTPTITFSYASSSLLVTPLAASVGGETVNLALSAYGTPLTLSSGHYTDTTAFGQPIPTYYAWYSNAYGNGPLTSASPFSGGVGGAGLSQTLGMEL